MGPVDAELSLLRLYDTNVGRFENLKRISSSSVGDPGARCGKIAYVLLTNARRPADRIRKSTKRDNRQ